MGKNVLLTNFIRGYMVDGIEGCSEVGDLLRI
jgi:hypothetical protein